MSFLFYFTVNGRLDVNVALNRPSYLSSTFTGWFDTYNASKGNDGDKTHCHGLVMPNSIAHSKYESNPWYGVDLGVVLNVAGVKFTNRNQTVGTGG